ncbi:hypothetical protein A4G19_10440 [Pasteurellaceae bacterium Macca]|nr:hypothetical protein [Pasteurellaceae bacterium Macca]
MAQRIKSPYFDKQASHCNGFNDWVILVGDKARFAYFKNGKEETAGQAEEWRLFQLAYRIPNERYPVILDSKQFNQIDRLHLAPEEQTSIKIFQVGEIPTMHKDKDDLRTRLLMNLAKHNPKIVAIEWVDNAMQGKNIYPELVSIRNKQFTVAEVLEKKPQPLDLSQKEVKQKEIATAFLKWSKRPLRRDVRVAKTYAYNGLYWEEINEEEISRLVMAFFDEHNGDYSISKIKKMAELAMLKMQPIPVPTLII